jgi:hypothetical protein
MSSPENVVAEAEHHRLRAINSLPSHDGGSRGSQSRGPDGPITACEVQETAASTTEVPPKQEQPGHTGFSSASPLLSCKKDV